MTSRRDEKHLETAAESIFRVSDLTPSRSASAGLGNACHGGTVEVLLPVGGPVLTAGVARALLKLLRSAASDPSTTVRDCSA